MGSRQWRIGNIFTLIISTFFDSKKLSMPGFKSQTPISLHLIQRAQLKSIDESMFYSYFTDLP